MNSKTVLDGDVTDDLCAGKDSAAKRAVCDKLNKDAKKKQSEALQSQLCMAAAQILRTRLTVVETARDAKMFMESASSEGIRARIVFIDITQLNSLQTKGAWSKQLCRQPSKVPCVRAPSMQSSVFALK